MRIKVIYPHRVGHVDSSELNRLIQRGEIMAFERERKLVVVGVHPTRKLLSKVYPGDRRGGVRTH
jgi:hypothetical protein